ncbi:MAG: hypothetical protein ACN6OS_20770 [Comamonas testosteroni]|uniref:hypothetical protein n=1 Tax=Comamonas testosteroni TaxID=285 RepID=UPI003D122BEC
MFSRGNGMYLLILLGAVVSALKLMGVEPVVDWSWYSLSMTFLFLLLWLVLVTVRRTREKNRENENDINSEPPEQPEVAVWADIHEWEKNRK